MDFNTERKMFQNTLASLNMKKKAVVWDIRLDAIVLAPNLQFFFRVIVNSATSIVLDSFLSKLLTAQDRVSIL